MSKVTPQMRKFARCLMLYEMRENKSSKIQTQDTFHVCEKLRAHLATLMGSGGFGALLSRALVLAKSEVSGLHAVRVNEVGILEGPEELYTRLYSKEFFESKVVLVAHLLALLAAFIGENLTVRLVSEVWPDVPLNDWDFGIRTKK